MNKIDLIHLVNEKVSKGNKNVTRKLVGDVVDATFDAIVDMLQEDGRASYGGFGTFHVTERAARPGRNPQTGEAMTIKASKTVTFKPTPTMKAKFN